MRPLTRRQREVLLLAANGNSNQAIAEWRGVTPHSVAEILTAADIVALVSAATAALATAPSVKTHLVSYFPAPESPFETTALG